MASSAFAQAPDTLWTRIYGDSTSNAVNCVIQTLDGGYFIVSNTDSSQWANILLVRLDPSGNFLWLRNFGGSDSDAGKAADLTFTGGYIVAGASRNFSPDNNWDGWLINLDSEGDTVWTRTYGDNNAQNFSCIKRTVDGGYVAAGINNNHCWCLKINQNGDQLWSRRYPFNGWFQSSIKSIAQTDNGDFLMTGLLWNADSTKLFIMKTDSQGDTIFTRIISPAGSSYGNCIRVDTNNGGFVVAGNVGDDISYCYLVKCNDDGDTLWTRMYGDGLNRYGEGRQELDLTSDAGYILVTELENPPSPNRNIYVVRTNSLGQVAWVQTYGPTGWITGGACVQRTADDGYIIGGYTKSSSSDDGDIYLVKLAGEQTDIHDGESILVPVFINLFQNYPNPFNPSTTINYQITVSAHATITTYNVLGQVMRTLVDEEKEPGDYSIVWDGKNDKGQSVASGTYFYELRAGDYTSTKKSLLLK